MPIGAETYLQPALQPVFDLIFSEGVKLFVKLTGGELEDTLLEWESELLLMNDVLDDAVHKQFQSKAVQRWLGELQDLAFDMEDILNDFAIQAQEHEFNMNKDQHDDEDVAQGVLNAVNYMVASISDGVSTLCNTISPTVQFKIEGINKRLHHIQTSPKYLHLSVTNNTQQQLTLQTEALRRQRESSSVVSESKVFGRDEMKQEIITRLLKDDDPSNESYAVIPIVGSGGIGKTTLAQCVYNDGQLKDHFNLMAWVCVSDVFDVKRITTTIIKAANHGEMLGEFSTLDEAQTQLMKILTSRKFLIVLDDIWNEEYDDWFRLQTPFKHSAKGSRVIMTTRNEDIARMMINHPVHDTISLKELSEDDCWKLFKQHVNDGSDLAEMRDDIIKKCNGLPLAAKALGGLFKKTVDNGRRRKILESNIWSEESGVLTVLRLSYDYLPAELKRVFAYCSLFPKDYEFKEKEIIFLWMAQGFLPNDEDMEESGQKYISELKSRSLFEQCPYHKGSFIMHDFVHDLALWAAGGICYAKGTKDIGKVNRERLRLRHVYLIGDATMQERQLIGSQLRTVYVDWTITNLDFIHSFRHIRALRLASGTIEVLPECIGDLKHLQFLRLKFGSIKELPKSINKLWNLQTLLLAGCINLKKLPDIGSLKKLHYLDLAGISLYELPQEFEKLKRLELGKFVLKDGHGFRVRELKNLNNLRGRIRISGLGNVTKVEDAKEAQLQEKCGVDELYLDWAPCNEEVDDEIKGEVLKQLKPPTSIQVFDLKRYMGLNLPGWLGDPSFNKIIKIRLEGCEKCERLPPLGQLPCLKTLEIQSMHSIKQIGVEFYGCSNPFPVLNYLLFEDMVSWEKWEHDRAFPCLEKLYIYRCHRLKTLEMYECQEQSVPKPHLILHALKYLEIRYCYNMESLPSEMHKYTSLQSLRISDCPEIQCIPEGRLPESLKTLEIGRVKTQDWVLYHLHSLERLNLCSLEVVQEGFCLYLPYFLSEVRIAHIQNLKNLSIVNGTNLKMLSVDLCQKLESLVGNFTSLEQLSLQDCPKLQHLPLSVSTSLRKLELCNLGRSTDEIKQIPSLYLHLPSSLRELGIGGFRNLKTINCSTLPNLNALWITSCAKFESFDATALPPQVYIKDCEMINPHLQSDPQNGNIRMDGSRYSLC